MIRETDHRKCVEILFEYSKGKEYLRILEGPNYEETKGPDLLIENLRDNCVEYIEVELDAKNTGETRFHEEIEVKVDGEQGICVGPVVLGNKRAKKAYVLFHESKIANAGFASSVNNVKVALTNLPSIDRAFGVKVCDAQDPNTFTFVVDDMTENRKVKDLIETKLKDAIDDQVVSIEMRQDGKINFKFLEPPKKAYTTSFGPHRIFKNTIDFLYKTRLYMTLGMGNKV